jgi:hypothetical protein
MEDIYNFSVKLISNHFYIMSIVPKECDYTKPVSLPSSAKTSSLISVPQGGLGPYNSGQQITFPLVQYGRLIPDSMYLSCNLKFVNGTTGTTNYILGVPALAWINRIDSFINSSTVETINAVGPLSQMILAGKMNAMDKLGLSYPFGINFGADGAFIAEEADSFQIPSATATGATVALQIAVPIPNIFSNADKFFPLGLGECRIQLTSDILSNFAATSAGATTTLASYTIENVQLMYDIIEFDEQTEMLINSQVDSEGAFYIKSESYAISSATIPTAFSGYVEIPYANSLTSIKSIYTLFCRSDRYRLFSSYDPTQSNGSVQWTIGSLPFPPTAIDTLNRRPTAVLEFLEALHGTKVSPVSARTCLSYVNFRDSTVAQGSDSPYNLSKAFFGCSLEKISGSYLLTGISSFNSNITVRVNIGTVTNVALNALTILNHDVLVKFTPSTRQVVVLK